MATRDDALAFEMHIDVIPVVEGSKNLSRCLFIRSNEIRESCIREDNAPTKSVVGAVAFDDGDLMKWVLLLHQKTKVETTWSTADAEDLHAWKDTLALSEGICEI